MLKFIATSMQLLNINKHVSYKGIHVTSQELFSSKNCFYFSLGLSQDPGQLHIHPIPYDCQTSLERVKVQQYYMNPNGSLSNSM